MESLFYKELRISGDDGFFVSLEKGETVRWY
jgi:hypothetical protein